VREGREKAEERGEENGTEGGRGEGKIKPNQIKSSQFE